MARRLNNKQLPLSFSIKSHPFETYQFLASKRFWEVSSQLEIVGEAEPLSEERHTSLTAGGLKKGSPEKRRIIDDFEDKSTYIV